MLLVTAMLLTMMTVPTLASGTVEITSPAYGAVVEVGEATKVIVASEVQPTVTAAGTAVTVTEASSGIWEAAWTPASSGMITLAATANGVTDSVIVRAVSTKSEFFGAYDMTNLLADNQWVDVSSGEKTVHAEDGYTTIAVAEGSVHGVLQYSTKDAKSGATGEGIKSGVAVLEADLRMSEDANALNFIHRASDSTQEAEFMTLFGNAGTVYVPNDPNNQYVNRFTVGAWVNLKIVFDMDASTYSIYLDDNAISYDNALPGTMADGVDGIIIKMVSYGDDFTGSYDVKNFTLRTFEQGLTIASPQSGTLQETNRKMPVVLSAKGIAAGDSIVVKGSDGATAEATVRADGKYVAYLVPTEESDAYTVNASVVSGGAESHTQSVTVKTAKTFQLGAWDFDTDATTGITESSDNFYSAQKSANSTITIEGGIGGKSADDKAFKLVDNSTENNRNDGLSFWQQGEQSAVLIGELDLYYDGTAIGIGQTQSNTEVYVAQNGSIQNPKTWANIAEISKDAWHHLKLVFDKTNQVCDIYLDDVAIAHREGVYDADTNPNGLHEAIKNETFFIGCPAWASGNMIVDNISIRTLDDKTNRATAKKVITNEIMPIGVLKPATSFEVNVGAGLGWGNTVTLYADDVKVGTMTKDGYGYYQATVTAPNREGTLTLRAEDVYGMVATRTVPLAMPDDSNNFAADGDNGTWKNGEWSVYTTNMVRSQSDNKLTSDGTNVGSYQIQAPETYTKGTVVLDFTATVPAKGTGNVTIKTREITTNAKVYTLGFISAENAGYNDPNNNNAWNYNSATQAGEQQFRYVFDIDNHKTTLYIGGKTVMSYTNPNLPSFSSLVAEASSASITNTLGNLEMYYIAPEEEAETPTAEGISNAKFTTVHGYDVSDAVLSGLRSVNFSADYLPTQSGDIYLLTALYENTTAGMVLSGTTIDPYTVTAGTSAVLKSTVTCPTGIPSGSEIRVYIWSADGTITPLESVLVP